MELNPSIARPSCVDERTVPCVEHPPGLLYISHLLKNQTDVPDTGVHFVLLRRLLCPFYEISADVIFLNGFVVHAYMVVPWATPLTGYYIYCTLYLHNHRSHSCRWQHHVSLHGSSLLCHRQFYHKHLHTARSLVTMEGQPNTDE